MRSDAGSMVKRKVAMHVAYCGTGYQGGPHIWPCLDAAAAHEVKHRCAVGTSCACPCRASSAEGRVRGGHHRGGP